MFTYKKDDGTEILIVVSDGKIYSYSAGVATQIGTIAGTGICYAVNLVGKLWIVNGTSFVKVEDTLNVYKVQIDAPVGATAAVVAGGSLAVGVYSCYVAYARKDAYGRYLYSLPQSVGDKTLTTGNQSITYTIPNSTDPQVTHKVVFMSEAGGTVQVFYGEVTNATATITISSTAARIGTVYMSTVSATNQILPVVPSGIYTFDDKLFVWEINGKNVYWSLKTDVNPFDLERFSSENFRTFSKSINSIFSVGTDLYFNHIGNGLVVATSGDMSSVLKHVQRQFWFLECRTPEGKSNVVFPNGIPFGLTNDGFRFFDGDTFSADISFSIKPDVDKIMASISREIPSAIIHRRPGKRTEYRFSYNNLDYGSVGCNDQRIFNLDFYFDSSYSKKTWECWENGFEWQAIIGDSWVGLQSRSAGSQIVRESGASDVKCYDRTSAYQTAKFIKQLYVLFKTHIDLLNAITVYGPVYALATSSGEINGNIILFDSNNAHFPFTISGITPQEAILPSEASGEGLALPFIMAPQYPVNIARSIAFACRGNSVTIEISQVEDDPDFFLYKLQLPLNTQVIHNLT
jgi:hypothetical protein